MLHTPRSGRDLPKRQTEPSLYFIAGADITKEAERRFAPEFLSTPMSNLSYWMAPNPVKLAGAL
ncbi:MAG: hypothetical protein ACWA49_09775 [Ruegeria sp.]